MQTSEEHKILKLMVAYARANDLGKLESIPVKNEDRRFILGMWYYFVCKEPEYLRKWPNSTVTASRMIRMNRLWNTLKPYYLARYIINSRYDLINNDAADIYSLG